MGLIVGLTGGIGSGKSAAANLFAELGVAVVDTDVIAHELTGPGGPAMPTITESFGQAVLAIETLQAGLPFTPQLGFNPTNNGDTRNPIRPSLNPAFTGKVILGRPNRYYDPNAFVLPAPGTYGNAGRNTLIGPGFATLDLSLLKTMALTERIMLQFRGEFFNILNRANFGTPNTIVFSSASPTPAQTAGVITSTAGTSRQIQFGLKISF